MEKNGLHHLTKNQLHMYMHHNKSYFAATGHFAKAHAKYISVRQASQSRFIFISGFVFLILIVIFSMNAMAQNSKKLSTAKTENKTENKSIIHKEKVGMTQEKQSGNLFEYVSISAAGSQSGNIQPFIVESLPVVFTTAETLPVLGGGEAAWNKLLSGHGASVVDTKNKLANNSVLVSYLLDATGKMYDVQVMQTSSQVLAERAIALMKATGISKPAFAKGQDVAYRGELILHFSE